ncbi:hypothetical protein Tco_0485392 [Tanacetum coccineum]
MENVQTKTNRTYANVTVNSKLVDNNKLRIIPTVLNELGEEVVVFYEEMARFGFKKIIDSGNGRWLFKFFKEARLNEVASKSPWMVNGISAIASCLGKHKIMDSMTYYVYKSRLGRTKYARVLVEIKAKKGLKEEIELQYRDKN